MWRHRLMPYPLLTKDNDDYPQSGFVCQVRSSVLSNGDTINLTLEYLLNSDTLRALIEEEQADYAVQTACVRTYSRDLHLSSHNQQHFLALPAEQYSEEVVLTPYIIATRKLTAFAAPEHNPEFRELKPEGFDIPNGSILAVADSKRVIIKETSPHSVIDLVPNPETRPGRYELDFSSDRIKIYVSPADKSAFERVRRQSGEPAGQNALMATLYLNVVTQALHHLPEYPETAWARAIQTALERHKIVADADAIRRNAPHYAQTILESPMGRLLNSIANAAGTE